MQVRLTQILRWQFIVAVCAAVFFYIGIGFPVLGIASVAWMYSHKYGYINDWEMFILFIVLLFAISYQTHLLVPDLARQ